MKKLVQLFLLIIIVTSTINAQSTERFIRIIGNAKHEFKANDIRAYFTISEVLPNEYKQITYSSLEDTYSKFIQKITEIGLNEDDINQSVKNINKYNKVRTKNYYIDVSDLSILNSLSEIKIEGYKLNDIKYIYKNIDINIESELSFAAITDARRKAQNICNEIGMTLGRILNIEDRSSGCCTDLKESKNNITVKTYKVTITFELID